MSNEFIKIVFREPNPTEEKVFKLEQRINTLLRGVAAQKEEITDLKHQLHNTKDQLESAKNKEYDPFKVEVRFIEVMEQNAQMRQEKAALSYYPDFVKFSNFLIENRQVIKNRNKIKQEYDELMAKYVILKEKYEPRNNSL